MILLREFKDLKIAVAGTGYVGLSIATLLSQHHKVTAVDIIPEKVELINNKKSPIHDGICIGHRHITRLHRNKFLVCLEVIIFRQNFRSY